MINVLLVFLLLLQPAFAGEVYTWTDADGNIHITDRPPGDSSQVESVIHYSNRPETTAPTDPVPKQNSVETQQLEQLSKQLKRLKERKTQLEKIIAENQTSIAAAEKDAEHYRRRSGSYARRNKKAIERQLMVLKNNLTTYQSDLLYVEEDIVENELLFKTVKQRMKPPGNASGAATLEN